MKAISSAEFRKTYHRLSEPYAITVNGHLIGVWTPGGTAKDLGLDMTLIERDEARALAIPKRTTMSQAERDAILRRVNKG